MAGFHVTRGSSTNFGVRVAAATSRCPGVSPEAYGRAFAAVVTGALRSANGHTRPALQASCGSSASWYSSDGLAGAAPGADEPDPELESSGTTWTIWTGT